MSQQDEYNQNQIIKGNIWGSHITKLTEHWQKYYLLKVDGKCGPDTLKNILGGDTIDVAKVDVLLVAEKEIGKGEDPAIGNNRGADVDRYRAGDGTGKGQGGRGSWCGSFVSFCHVEAAGGFPPFETSRGAKRLGRNVAAVGRECDLPEPGAVIVWDRGKLKWRGHVGLCHHYDVTTDTLITIEGNKNRRGQRFAKVGYFTYPNGLWRKKLDRIATLAKIE